MGQRVTGLLVISAMDSSSILYLPLQKQAWVRSVHKTRMILMTACICYVCPMDRFQTAYLTHSISFNSLKLMARLAFSYFTIEKMGAREGK